MWKSFSSVCLLFFLVLAPCSQAADLPLRGTPEYIEKVVFFVGTESKTNLWDNKLLGILDRAGSIFPMEIEIVQTTLVKSEIVKNVEDRVLAGPPFDYAIVLNQRGTAVEVIETLAAHGVKSFLFNTALSERDRQRVKGPRQYIDNWIGEALPRDEIASYRLTEQLISKAKSLKSNPAEIRIFALSGVNTSQVSRKRVQGLKDAVSKRQDVEIVHITTGRWNRDVSRQKITGMYKRYGRPDIIWCANDEMTLGAVDAMILLNVEVNSVVVGGFDWSPEIFDNIRTGRIEASAGGHYLDLFLVLALIDRHARGLDFKYLRNGPQQKTDLTILDNSNLEDFSTVNFLDVVSENHIDLIASDVNRTNYSAKSLLSAVKR